VRAKIDVDLCIVNGVIFLHLWLAMGLYVAYTLHGCIFYFAGEECDGKINLCNVSSNFNNF